MHLDRPFGEAAVPVFTWTNQLPFAAQSNQATRALDMDYWSTRYGKPVLSVNNIAKSWPEQQQTGRRALDVWSDVWILKSDTISH